MDELHAELEKQKVIHPSEPLETKPFGVRQFGVLDADGNTITFAEPVSQPGARRGPRSGAS